MVRRIIKQFFNYYIVLKACWSIVLFQVIGYFALVVFDQGQDIIRGLTLAGSGTAIRHTVAGFIALMFWSWQSWRGSRTLLHLSYFNFWTYRPRYSFRAQVMIPRILAFTPYLLLAWAAYKANGRQMNNLVILCLSIGLWFVIFLYFRKTIIVWLRAKRPKLIHWVPDYIPIKNGAYPVIFIWKKQRIWLTIRLVIVIAAFIVITVAPISISQYVGSLTLVLFGFGTWLVLASVINFLELRLNFPIFLSLFLLVVVFSFFNNNHRVLTLSKKVPERTNLHQAFDKWIEDKKTTEEIPVFLVGAEGGGIRAAYWTASVLGYLEETQPGFSDNIFTFSSVSGGSLGVMVHNASLLHNRKRVLSTSRSMLSHDFLAPVSSYLIYPDMLQKFIPFQVPKFDRAKILERSWELAYEKAFSPSESNLFSQPFVTIQQSGKVPHVMLNGTHVESGYRTVVSDIDMSGHDKQNLFDLVSIMGNEIPVSTAVGLSARFPFITPPALVYDKNNREWGNVVDGGYYENLGATTLVEIYKDLREYAKDKGLNVRFHLVFIRNTKRTNGLDPISGVIEFQSAFRTLANIWGNNGDDVIRSVEGYIEDNNDRLVIVKLMRDSHVNIPLGWYLSNGSVGEIDKLLNNVKPMLDEEILTFTK